MAWNRTLIVLSVAILAGCQGANPIAETTPGNTEYKVETVATGLEVPWAIAFVPDGRIFVTERPGRIRVIKNGVLEPTPLATLTDIVSGGEGGLMDLTLHPNFATNHLLYVSFVASGSPKQVKVVRFKESAAGLTEPKTIVEGIAAAMFHCGCRCRFGPDGKLYITTGERFEKDRAQDLNDLCGKTLRLNDDGTIPSDNPFFGQAGKRSEIWSYGHRNSQGVAWHPESGLMFQTEHGPSGSDAPGGGDEVNVVEKGKNYGWPIIHHTQTQAGLESPLLEYTPALAPGGCMFYSGKLFPQWKNDFFFVGLAGKRMIRAKFSGKTPLSQEAFFSDVYGRLRDVAEAPAGSIYFCTRNRDGRGSPSGEDDRILRIVPK